MPSPLRVLVVALCLAVMPLHAAAWTLPPVDGELSGDVSPLPGAPSVHWKITVRLLNSETRQVILAVDGEGARIRAEAELHGDAPDGAWKLTEATIDTKRWLPALTGPLQLPADLVGTGVFTVTGEGQLREGRPEGTVHVRWRDGTLASPGAGWTLSAVSCDAPLALDFARGASVSSTAPATLSVGTISTTRFGAQNLVVNGMLRSLAAFDVSKASIEIAGGDAVISPTTISLNPPSAGIDVQLTRIGLQDVAALVPDLVTAAYGRVDGEVRFTWSKADGLVLEKGHVVLRTDEPASVRLAPSPGLITSTLPKTVLKYYPGLDKAELGQVPIRASALDVEFSGKPDSEGRTAVVHLFGVPDAPDARGPIDLNLNVRGPLQPFIKLGTNTRFSVGVR